MSTYTVDGLRYYIEEAGAGQALLLLHGFSGKTTHWRELMERLAEQYRVLSIDLPGHGRSDAPDDLGRYAMDRVTADLALLLDHLNAVPAHWLGYSMGGRLALYAAVERPWMIRSIILESASPGLKDEVERAARRQQDESLAGRIEAGGIPSFVAEWEKLPLFATQEKLAPETRALLRERRLANSARGLANSLRGMGTGVQPSLWEKLGSIDMPVLLMAGALDHKFVAINRQMAAVIPGAELHIIGDAGHAIHLEQPEHYAQTVLKFLSDRLENGGEDMSQTKQSDEGQGGHRHLL